MKKTKKSLVLSIITLLLCSAMFIGSTFAWFTDTVSNTGNKIQAGTLKIDLLQDEDELHTAEGYKSIKDNTAPVFDSGEGTGLLWEPGQTQVAYLAVANKGNLALKYNIILDVVDRETNEDLTQAMAGAFTYAVINQESPASVGGDWPTVKAAAVAPYGYNANLLAAIQEVAPGAKSARITAAPTGKLQPNDKDYFVIAIHMDEEAGNAYQNGLIEFDVNVVATQLNSEEDGFESPDYDKLAAFPSIAPRIEGKGKTDPMEVKEGKIEGNQFDPTTGEEEQFIEVKSTSSTTSTNVLGSANIPVSAVNNKIKEGTVDEKNSIINQMQDLVQEAPETGVDVKDEIVITLNVNTKAATTVSIDLDVSMLGEITRTITPTGSDTPTSVEVKQTNIKELAAPVIVNIDLEAGLDNVTVTHTHEGEAPVNMEQVEKYEDLADGKFFYNKTSGGLSLKTSRFSEFDIKYTRDDVAENIDKGISYSSLADAFKEAKAGETIKVLKDTDVPAEVVKNVTLDVDGKKVSNVITINDATLTVKGGGTFYANTNENGIININEGTYQDVIFGGTGKVNISGGAYEKLNTLEGATVVVKVSGGKFAFDPTEYVEELCYVEGPNDGWYEVKKFGDNIVATIGNTGYTSFNSAIAAVSGGQTVKMVKNVNYTDSADSAYFAPAASGNRTLDLNGKTVSIDFGTFAPSMNAVLDIRESWSGTYGCTITLKDTKGTGKLVAIQNPSKTIVAAIGNNTHNFMNFVIEGGTYEGSTHGAFFQAGNVTINGGTFVGPTAFEYGADDYSGTQYGDLIINDGIFDGDFVIARKAEKTSDTGAKLNTIVVNGGKFRTNNVGKYLAEGKILVEENEWYIVKDASDVPAEFTARMDKIYFTTSNGPDTAMNLAKEKKVAEVELKASTDVALVLTESDSITIIGEKTLYTAPIAAQGFTLKTEEVEGGTLYYVPEIKPFTLNGKDYDDLTSVIDATPASSCTIKLNKDFTVTSNVTYSWQRSATKNLTIDLQGHTLTLADGIKLIFANKKDIVTVQNGTIIGKVDGGSDMIEFYNTQSTEGVKLINLTLENKGSGWIVYDIQSTSICPTKLIENCTITGAKASIANYTVKGNTVITQTSTSGTKLETGIVKDEVNYNYVFADNGYSVTVTPKQ